MNERRRCFGSSELIAASTTQRGRPQILRRFVFLCLWFLLFLLISLYKNHSTG